jgi:nicotinate phosphoribosyltransferase
MRFYTAAPAEIKAGDTTDIYFRRTKEILDAKKIDRRVVAEFTVSSLPPGYGWGILTGLEEVAYLLEGYNVDLYALPEGSVFYPTEPVIRIEGNYREFCEMETPLLGLICQASGITTKTARLKKIAGKRALMSFGIRRMHPIIAPMIDRAAYVGGADGFSGMGAEKIVGRKAVGTMPHALIITVGDQVRAWRYFDEVVSEEVPRVALVDTYYDEKIEAIMAAEAVEGLYGVRLDTPGSRRGEMKQIVEEVRWELDLRGYQNVKIIVSGGIDEDEIRELDRVDGFGIGTSISSASTLDFAMDIVEMEGKPCAKRGKLGGKKEVFGCPLCLRHRMVPIGVKRKVTCPTCHVKMESLLQPLVKGGKIVGTLFTADEVREFVLHQLEKLEI